MRHLPAAAITAIALLFTTFAVAHGWRSQPSQAPSLTPGQMQAPERSALAPNRPHFNYEAMRERFRRGEVLRSDVANWEGVMRQSAEVPLRQAIGSAQEGAAPLAAELTTLRKTMARTWDAGIDWWNGDQARSRALVEGASERHLGLKSRLTVAVPEINRRLAEGCASEVDARNRRFLAELQAEGIPRERIVQLEQRILLAMSDDAHAAIAGSSAATAISQVGTAGVAGAAAGLGTGAAIILAGGALSPETLGVSALVGAVAGGAVMWWEQDHSRRTIEAETRAALARLEGELRTRVHGQVQTFCARVLVRLEQAQDRLGRELDGEPLAPASVAKR